MRRVTFKRVLETVIRMQGLDPDTVSTAQKARRAEHISRRVAEGWELDWWPEWTPIEERAFRPTFSLTTTYNQDDEVWDSTALAYYKCLLDSTVGIATSNATYWEAITTLTDLYVLYEQTYKTRIGEIEGVYLSNDDARRGIRRIKYYHDTDRIRLFDDDEESEVGNTVWIRFRKQPSQFTSEVWVAGQTYQEGWIVYWPDSTAVQIYGECYRASYDTNGQETWELQELPQILHHFVILGALSDALKEDGQIEKSALYETMASVELDRVQCVVFGQQGIYRRTRVNLP